MSNQIERGNIMSNSYTDVWAVVESDGKVRLFWEKEDAAMYAAAYSCSAPQSTTVGYCEESGGHVFMTL